LFSQDVKIATNLRVTPNIPKVNQRSRIAELIIFSNYKALVLNNESVDTYLAKYRMCQEKNKSFIPGELIHIVAHIENSSNTNYNKLLELHFLKKNSAIIDNSWIKNTSWEIIGDKGAQSVIVTNGVIPNFKPDDYLLEFILRDETGKKIDESAINIKISPDAQQSLFMGQVAISESREIKGDNESTGNYYNRLKKATRSQYFPGSYLNIGTFFSAKNVDPKNIYSFDWTFISPSGDHLTYNEFFAGKYNTRNTPVSPTDKAAKNLKNINFRNIAGIIPLNIDKAWFGEWRIDATFSIGEKTIKRSGYLTLLPTTNDCINFESYRKPIKETIIAGEKKQTIKYKSIRGIKMPVIITGKSLKQWKEEENENSIINLLDKISDNQLTFLEPGKSYYMVTNAGVEGINSNNDKVKIGAVFIEKNFGSEKKIQILDNTEYKLHSGNVISEFNFILPKQIKNELIEVSSLWRVNNAVSFKSPPVLVNILRMQ